VITNFKSLQQEGLYEIYSRFRKILRNCPHHDFSPWLIIHTFYAGVSLENRDLLDLLTGGSFTEYGVYKALNLLETIHKDKTLKESEAVDSNSLVELEYINNFMQSDPDLDASPWTRSISGFSCLLSSAYCFFLTEKPTQPFWI
jgi:hypothetical protein